MHKHRRRSTFLLASATVVMFGSAAFAQVDAPPAPPAPEAAPVDVPPPPPPPPPPPVEVAPPPPVPPAAVPMQATVAATTAVAPSQSPFKIETPNGSSIKLGLLLQPQFQSVSSPTLSGYSNNLYIRRTRILLGGTLFGAIEYFVETDAPNLFLAGNEMGATTQIKATPGVNIQDAFATAKPFGDVFKVDVGYMLPPLSHNAVQGAGTLYSWDYFANTFNSTAGTLLGSASSPVGRDAGVQARGLLMDGHLEYRIGLFQGIRNAATTTDVGANNFFRAAARLQFNLLQPETGFFYAGSYLGAKRILSIGLFGDEQDSFHYRFFGGDVFADLPLGPGVFTGQVNVVHWTGGGFVNIPRETAVMGEVGYIFAGARVSPIVRIEELWNSDADNHTGRFSGGLAWWPYGHNSNLKAFFTNIRESAGGHFNQINLQWQVYFF
jgi:hypothetical protein